MTGTEKLNLTESYYLGKRKKNNPKPKENKGGRHQGQYWPKYVFKEMDFKWLCRNSFPESSLVQEEALISVVFRLSLTLWEHCNYSTYSLLQAYVCRVSSKSPKPKIHITDCGGSKAELSTGAGLWRREGDEAGTNSHRQRSPCYYMMFWWNMKVRGSCR